MLYLAFRGTDFRSLWTDLKQARYIWVILALIVSVFSHLIRAMRWKLLIEPLGYSPSTGNVFKAILVGYLANLAAPRLGEVSRCGSLNRTDKIPVDSLLGTVIVERTIDLISLILLTVLVFFMELDLFGNFITQNIYQPLSEKFLNLFSSTLWIWLFLGIPLMVLFLAWHYRRMFSKFKFYQKLRSIAKGIFRGITSVSKMKKLYAFLGHSLLMWLLYFLMTWIMVFTLPETSMLTPADGLFLLVIGSYGMAAPVQGGIGAFHWIISRGITIFDIPFEKGLVYATIIHESQLLLILLLGSISFVLVGLNRKKT